MSPKKKKNKQTRRRMYYRRWVRLKPKKMKRHMKSITYYLLARNKTKHSTRNPQEGKRFSPVQEIPYASFEASQHRRHFTGICIFYSSFFMVQMLAK
jgi:hypothetical protein